MSRMKTNLCIGGPADGKQYHTREDVKYFNVSIWKDELLPVYISPTSTVKTETITYVEESIHGENEKFTFWRPENQSVDDTIRRLFERYLGVV